MGKIHPTENNRKLTCNNQNESSIYTVWKKSSMAFQGTDGFTVYNCEGKLSFRVDNYSRKHKELFLMDGHGKTLLALRPKILSIHDQWNGYKVTENVLDTIYSSRIFSMRRRSFLNKDDEVEVFMLNSSRTMPDFKIEGSFWRRNCKIRSRTGEVVAHISRKKANKPSVLLSDDVFTLVIIPGVDHELIMALVVVMDRVCQKPYTPLICT